jgi:hypothetical protein
MMGICSPDGESGCVAVVGGARPRRERGTYGVYVVWRPCEVGCLGGGGRGPALGSGLDCAGVIGEGRGRFDTEEEGDEALDEIGVAAMDDMGDRGVGTTSG